ncbi:hypothetical protein [Haloarcula sp. CBA1115]|uniref:hypothetical protein n=1 Tax=Haloarcula sp. CBA1115 TaxID=1592728 RepID=UPI0012AB8088|nr:hypothetical protein [Haloarcula sp. CBA1115]
MRTDPCRGYSKGPNLTDLRENRATSRKRYLPRVPVAPFSNEDIEMAVDHLYEAHEQRETEAEANWEETLRDTEIPNPGRPNSEKV